MPRTTPTSNTRTVRRVAVALTGTLGGVAFALALPTMAGAHVGVTPDELTAGDHAVLTFSFSHGCENSPTTALRITMPDGLASAAPTADGDWQIDVERGDDGLVSAVTYTAATPVPTDLRGAVSMGVGLHGRRDDRFKSSVRPVAAANGLLTDSLNTQRRTILQGGAQ